MTNSGGPLDNQTCQTEWRTAPLAKVQFCEYENQTLEALLVWPAVLYRKMKYNFSYWAWLLTDLLLIGLSVCLPYCHFLFVFVFVLFTGMFLLLLLPCVLLRELASMLSKEYLPFECQNAIYRAETWGDKWELYKGPNQTPDAQIWCPRQEPTSKSTSKEFRRLPGKCIKRR